MQPSDFTALIHCRDSEAPVPLVMSFRGPYRFLSNFYPVDITLPPEMVPSRAGQVAARRVLPALTYPSVENAYMAWKTLNPDHRRALQALSPKAAKEFSRTGEFLAGLRPEYSDMQRLKAMLRVTRGKYAVHATTGLANRLVEETGTACLVEGNTWHDRFFGFCVLTGQGQNYLGRILMTVRDEVRIAKGLAPVLAEPVLPAPVLER